MLTFDVRNDVHDRLQVYALYNPIIAHYLAFVDQTGLAPEKIYLSLVVAMAEDATVLRRQIEELAHWQPPRPIVIPLTCEHCGRQMTPPCPVQSDAC